MESNIDRKRERDAFARWVKCRGGSYHVERGNVVRYGYTRIFVDVPDVFLGYITFDHWSAALGELQERAARDVSHFYRLQKFGEPGPGRPQVSTTLEQHLDFAEGRATSPT